MQLKRLKLIAGLISCGILAQPAAAGPPFLTDDPEPTETGHWEIYGPLFETEGQGSDYSGSAGLELNYGAAPNLQVTAGLPIGYSHDAAGWHLGAGDIKLSAKYRVYHNEAAGLQVAVFPGLTLPTASNGQGAGRVTALLPVWVQKDWGAWSVFGGGGYAINPGAGNRNYWTGGLAVSRKIGPRLLIGVEIDRSGADAIGASATTRLGIGAIYRLDPHLRLLASGGPTIADGGGAAGYHGFLALGFDY